MNRHDHEVKGSAFVTVARWLQHAGDPDAVARYLDALDDTARIPVRDATAGQWYPESIHVTVLHAVFDVLAHRDIPRFERIIADCTTLGVQTFAKLVLSMSSPTFVLRRCPTLWSVLRRGPSSVAVDQDGAHSVLHYRDFPFFDDVLYRHYIRALLGALVRPSLGREPAVEIVAHGPDWLDVAVTID